MLGHSFKAALAGVIHLSCGSLWTQSLGAVCLLHIGLYEALRYKGRYKRGVVAGNRDS